MQNDEYTVGVEEEYQLVDDDTGELRSRARDVLAWDWTKEFQIEVHQTMLEIGTRVCKGSRDLRAEIERLRTQVATAAAAEDLTIVAAGMHPYSRWEVHTPTSSDRFDRLLDRFGRVLWTEHIFGMHVHVAIPEDVDRISIMNQARVLVPEILALSASSPFYEGRDTGYSSYRTIQAQRLPHSGIPPRFADEADFRRFIEIATESTIMEDSASVYWSIRPHATHPTLEFRSIDACPRIDDAVAIATLIRLMVIEIVRGEWKPAANFHGSTGDAILQVNEWQASRYGLHATIADLETDGRGMPIRSSIERLIERLAPIADEFEEVEALEQVRRILKRGNAADRMRARSQQATFRDQVRWLIAESAVGTGMDRRAEQRMEETARPI